ncbi:MAG: LytTR family DNA-binding domain-containing protein, partial [Flavobacteriales bacterium]
LDIQMPEKTGFELLEELENMPQVIFVTAYDEYAIKAFEVNALDYILKPVDPKRLEKIMLKLEEMDSSEKKIPTSKLRYQDQIFIKDGDNCWFVKLGDIRLFESVGNYVKVYFNDNKPMLLRSLNKIEERLDEKEFFRVNRKHIVNMTWIEKVDNWFSGGLKLTLRNGEEVEVSRRQAQKFRENRSL